MKDAVLAHAAAEHPREACGVLLARDDVVVEAVAARNVAPNPETGFEIDPALLLATYRRARGEGLSVAGWYHSHPNGVGEPSVTDAARAVEDGKLWVIAAGGTLSAWRVAAGGEIHDRFTRVELVA